MTFITDPIVALFLSLALGYLVGKIRFGPIEVGGVCGTLFVALLIGQLGVSVSPDLKGLAFALFIYVLGYSAGPQFFANIRQGWRFGLFPVIEVVTAVALTLLFVWMFSFDPGTAAGVFAGSATESAVVGTASEAVTHLNLPDQEASTLQSNIATAYSLTYLFGLIGIVVFASQIAPIWLKIDLKQASADLAVELGAQSDEAESSLPTFDERAFKAGPASGKTLRQLEEQLEWSVAIGGIRRGDKTNPVSLDERIADGDILFVRGRRNSIIAAEKAFGPEVQLPGDAGLAVTSLEVILSSKKVFGSNLKKLAEIAPPELRRGVLVREIRRMGHEIPNYPNTVLQQGDVLTLYGPADLLEWAAKELGEKLPPQGKTDFIFLSIGLIAGLLIGTFNVNVLGADLHLGRGGGALLSGLFFGWLSMRLPAYGTLPKDAANFAKDFGLSIFIAAIGLQAGPDAWLKIKEYGLILPLVGVVVSVFPAMVSLYIGHKWMKIQAPILLGAIAGQHCSTPTISALVEKAGNSVPVLGYTVTYAIGNVLLPLMGPIIVALVYHAG